MSSLKEVTIIFVVVMALGFASCKTYQNVPYFANIPSGVEIYKKGEDSKAPEYTGLKVKPDDLLVITVNTLDNRLSVFSRNEVRTQDSQAEQSHSLDGFLVSSEGAIDLPLLGTLNVSGLTTAQIRNLVKQKAVVYYKDPVVNVRISNFKITVLGEVNKPGIYYIGGEKATLLDALGLAGDLTIFGKRENVMLLRQVGDKQKAVRYNLNDGQALNSPYLYLQQNDVVYVEPNKNKSDATDVQKNRTISILGTLASFVVIILTRVL